MNRIARVFANAFKQIGADIWLNVATVSVIALALMLVGAFILIAANASDLVSRFAGQVEVIFYLTDSYNEEQAVALTEKLQADPTVASAGYVTKAEAIARFRKDMADLADVADSLEENPFPASIEVKLKTEYKDLPDLELFAQKYGREPGVEEAYYGKEWAARLARLARTAWIAGIAIGAFVAAAAVYIIATFIRLSIHRRREEVAVMRLVGATNRYIRAPFILVGMLHGLIGAGLSVAALYGVFRIAVHRFAVSPGALGSFFPGFTPHFPLPQLVAVPLLLGALVGLFGSLASVGKFLKV